MWLQLLAVQDPQNEYLRPDAYVPEAVVTGFFICNPPRLTERETAITKSPRSHRKRDHQRTIAFCPAWFRLCMKDKHQYRMPYAFSRETYVGIPALSVSSETMRIMGSGPQQVNIIELLLSNPTCNYVSHKSQHAHANHHR